MASGRPTAYKKEFVELAENYCLLGATDEELAEFFGVSTQTLYTWKKKHPDFLEAIKEGKERADSRVAKSLYDQALDGNTTAAIFWLKNRRKQHWRDKHDHEVTGKDGGALEIQIVRYGDNPATE